MRVYISLPYSRHGGLGLDQTYWVEVGPGDPIEVLINGVGHLNITLPGYDDFQVVEISFTRYDRTTGRMASNILNMGKSIEIFRTIVKIMEDYTDFQMSQGRAIHGFLFAAPESEPKRIKLYSNPKFLTSPRLIYAADFKVSRPVKGYRYFLREVVE
jgi:hypothetical protein